MAGKGSRFADAGYPIPKPFIPIHDTPMIKVVVDNLSPKCEHRFIFVCQQSHIEQYGLVPKLKSYSKNVEIIGINRITEGQVCTALLAKKFFNNDEPLMNANADQFIDFDIIKTEILQDNKLSRNSKSKYFKKIIFRFLLSLFPYCLVKNKINRLQKKIESMKKLYKC